MLATVLAIQPTDPVGPRQLGLMAQRYEKLPVTEPPAPMGQVPQPTAQHRIQRALEVDKGSSFDPRRRLGGPAVPTSHVRPEDTQRRRTLKAADDPFVREPRSLHSPPLGRPGLQSQPEEKIQWQVTDNSGANAPQRVLPGTFETLFPRGPDWTGVWAWFSSESFCHRAKRTGSTVPASIAARTAQPGSWV